ncbi:Protein UmuD [BD1-7 clade bacterium]|uniref:Protein UmuD n=1 Tax=BD1-7 clade bacterium TaxID=2029982 RepID=A0A5S9Q870_9GAMM|nr:Protein UmuD [BD1-7 clade bacterium]CAA0114181.1 Protein UmuD [BD1-7 clade bacterium]
MKVAAIQSIDIPQQMALALFLSASADVASLVMDNEDATPQVPALDLADYLPHSSDRAMATFAADSSMQAQGIWEGDLLLVDRVRKPAHDDIVVASVDGDILCCLLDMKNSVLVSGDSEQAPIRLSEHVGLTIEGVVTQSIRQIR